jgi:hypothetical protein
MARKKNKGTDLSVFKGREAKLNRAVFKALFEESPLVIYDITRLIRRQRYFGHTKYTNVSRRVKALEQKGFVRVTGSRLLQAGSWGNLYQLTTRAYVAFLLSEVHPDNFIREADEETLITELAALTLFFEKTRNKTKEKQSS